MYNNKPQYDGWSSNNGTNAATEIITHVSRASVKTGFYKQNRIAVACIHVRVIFFFHQKNDRANEFYIKLGKTSNETYNVCGNECLSRVRVCEWFKHFQDGWQDVECANLNAIDNDPHLL